MTGCTLKAFIVALASVLAAGFLVGPTASAGAAEIIDGRARIAGFADAARACLRTTGNGKELLAVGVLGIDGRSTSVNDDERGEILSAIEALIASQPGIVLRPVTRLGRIATRMRRAGASDDEIVRAMRRVQDVDVAIYFSARRKGATRVELTLSGITRDGNCLIPASAGSLEARLGAGPRKHVLKKLIEAELVPAILRDARINTIIVDAFRAGRQSSTRTYSLCSEPLAERSATALSRFLRRDATAIAKGRGFAVRRGRASSAAGEGTRVLRGSFGRDAGGLWVSAELLDPRDKSVVAGFSRQYVVDVDCPVETLGLIDFIVRGARENSRFLVVDSAEARFRVDHFIRFHVRVPQRETMLYCWAISDDGTAYVVLPNPGADARRVHETGMKVYPAGFGQPEIRATEKGAGIFGCFAAHEPLSDGLHDAWMAAHFANREDARMQLAEDEILTLLNKMRAHGGMFESYAHYEIR